MGVAKRLYLYTVAAVSLLVLSIGVYNLLALVLGEVADALGASLIGGGQGTGREQVSLAIALVAVGAPVFAIHWTLVGRGWRGTGPGAVDDRFSSIRAAYLGLAASVALALAVVAGLQLVSRLFEWHPRRGGCRVRDATCLGCARDADRCRPDLGVSPATPECGSAARSPERVGRLVDPAPSVRLGARRPPAPGDRQQLGHRDHRVRADRPGGLLGR